LLNFNGRNELIHEWVRKCLKDVGAFLVQRPSKGEWIRAPLAARFQLYAAIAVQVKGRRTLLDFIRGILGVQDEISTRRPLAAGRRPPAK